MAPETGVVLVVLTAPTTHEDTVAPRECNRSRGAAEALLDVPAAYGGWGAFLDQTSREEVRRLLQRCREDLALHGAGFESEQGLARLLRALPRRGLGEGRVLAGLFDADGELLAMIDAVRVAPGEGTWFLAGLLVRPDVRGRGIAAALLEALEDWVRAEGGRVIQFPVQRRNRQALQFARRSGFAPRVAAANETSLEHLVRDVA